MVEFLQFALLYANGRTQYTEELKPFISIHHIDVMLISETHFTEKSRLNLPHDATYHRSKPAETARGGTLTIIQASPTKQL
jgi:hypothetical protein